MRAALANPRLWLGGAIAAFTALIVLPRALRAQWPPALTVALAALACALLAVSWVVGKQASPRAAIALGAIGLAVIAAAAWRWL